MNTSLHTYDTSLVGHLLSLLPSSPIRFDKSCDEARLADKLVKLLFILLSQPTNKEQFLELEGLQLLDVCKKCHKKNKNLMGEIDVLIGHITK